MFFSILMSGFLPAFQTGTARAASSPSDSERGAASTPQDAPASQSEPRALFAPGVSVSLDMPSTVFLGDDFNFTATFDNNGSDPGYGPFIDLVFPVTGADGDDGIDFISASYLGADVETVEQTFPDDGGGTGCVDHPWVKDSNGDYVEVCGKAGDKLVSLKLPFGSFVPDQPPADVTIQAHLSNKADLGTTPLIRYRGGYIYGEDPLDNWCCGDTPIAQPSDPDTTTWPSDTVEPIVMTMSKSYNGPSNTSAETATGPNYPRTYTIAVDIATGQQVAALHIVDNLPNDVQFTGYTVKDASGNTLSATANTTPSTSTPGGTLDVTLDNTVTGADGDDVFVTIEYYVPLNDATSSRVIAPDTGAEVNSTNSATVTGDWTPLDTRDTPAPVSVTAIGTPGDVTVSHRSLAIQKSVNNITDSQNSPGDVLEYTLTFQVSDFFAFDQIVVTDIISDGQHVDSTFTPTLQINGNAFSLAATSFSSGNYDVACDYTGTAGTECSTDNTSAPNTGKTTLTFKVSDELATRGLDSRLVGGCVDPSNGSNPPSCNAYNDGATEGTIVFHTIIQEEFTDDHPSGDASVDQGDILRDDSDIDGRNLDTVNFQPTGSTVTDDAEASISIGRDELTKAIYAINDDTNLPTDGAGNVVIKPGDKVTYRLTYLLPTSDVEELSFEDFLPLPVFDVSDPDADGTSGPSWSFSSAGGIPAPGVVTLGPSDTFYQYMTDGLNNGTGTLSASIHNTTPTQDPVVTSNTAANSIAIYYADYDDTRDQGTTVDLLFSITVSAEPFADGLMLTNEAHAYEGSTNASDSTANAIVQVKLTEPVLVGKKGVVWTSNPNAALNPEAGGGVTWLDSANTPRWTGTINSSGLASHPIDANVSGVDAGDTVTFAITIENQGASLNGAFDITLRDVMDSTFYQIPSGGLNLQIYYGDGSESIPYKAVDGSCTVNPYANNNSCGEELFEEGIELIDPVDKGACQAHDPNSGNNVIMITYDLEVKPDVHPGETVNTLHLMSYAGAEGAPNHLAADLTDEARGTMAAGFEKTLENTEVVTTNNGNDEVAIGEIVTYKLTATIPEGQVPNAQMSDHLDGGLAFVRCVSVTPSSADVTTDLSSGSDFSGVCSNNVTVTSNGQDVTFDLGNITNANRDNNTAETLTITYEAVALNVSGNQGGTVLGNEANFSMDAGSGRENLTDSRSADDVTVLEPNITLNKVANPTSVDAGDTVTYTVTLTNGNSATDTDAYELEWTDTLPAGMTYVSGTLATGTCSVAPDTLDDSAAPTLTATWATFPKNTSCEITFDATVDYSVNPGDTLTNTANATWTSMSGDHTSARSTYNTDSTERTGADGVGGALNDYASEDSAVVTITNPVVQKYVVDTSEPHTTEPTDPYQPDTNNPIPVAIGEIVRYRLVVTIPEGSSPNFQISDRLPAGLIFLNDNTAKISFISNNGISSSPTGTLPVPAIPSSCNATGSTADATTPSSLLCTLADENIASTMSTSTNTDSYGSGTDIFFKLGDLQNNDSDADAEYVVIEFNAIVHNSITNQNDAGDKRGNHGRVYIDGTMNGNDSADVYVRVVEPHLTVDKTLVSAATDAGDPMTYRISITNDSSGASAAAAFDLILSDTLDTYLDLRNAGDVVIYADGTNGSSDLSGGSCGSTSQTVTDNSSVANDTVRVDISCLNPGETVVVDITAYVENNVPAGYTIGNTASGTGTSYSFSPDATGSGTLTATKGTLTAHTGAITVSAGALSAIKIRDEAGGGGSEVGTISMTTDDSRTFYAAGYDADGNYIADQSVTWAYQ
jgi:uncharacterized repeat protein (TIGR01451 family)/fimbrial isopeptide formation D2 family protein